MNFDNAFNLLMQLEGGLVTDSGGLTKFGISAHQYPNVDIANLTQEDAQAIYLKDYWQAGNCEQLPSPLNICLFCIGVDQGMGTVTQLLQKSLKVIPDGAIGPVTQKAIANANIKDVIINFMAECAIRYSHCASFPIDGYGWMRRILLIMQNITY